MENKYIDFYKFNDLIQHCNKNEKNIKEYSQLIMI